MATVGPYHAEQTVFQTTASGALSTGNAHAHYVFGLWAAPAEGVGLTDARLASVESTSAAVALISGSTASTDTILVRAIYVAMSTVAGDALFINGSSTGSTLINLDLLAGTSPASGYINLPGAGVAFGSSAGVFYQSTSLSGVTVFYSTGVQDGLVTLVSGSSTGSTLATFAFPAGTPPQYIPFPQGAMQFPSTLGVFVNMTNMHSVSVFYSTL